MRAGGRALTRIVNKIFHGSAERLLATLVEDREFTAEEIARMRSILGPGGAAGGRKMIAWMVYAAVVGGVVAVGGWACERLTASAGRPRRIAWLAALTVAVVVSADWGDGASRGGAVVETGAAEPPAIGGAVVGDLWSAIPTLPVPEGMATGRIALLAWGAGSLVSLAVLGGVLLAVARGRRRWERRRVHGADVYVSRRFGPALVGVTRPKVVIPAWVLQLEPGARDAIIRHEAEHARARDHLALLYGGLVAAAFPWNPAIWWMYRRLRAAVELDCDQRVLASGIGVADYGACPHRCGVPLPWLVGFLPGHGPTRESSRTEVEDDERDT